MGVHLIKGQILYGINNLFTIDVQGQQYEARIKGKQLKNVTDEYNALAGGDWVMLDENIQITARLPRENILARFNWKQNRPQALAANLDCAFCVVAVDSPPLHLRFLDRLLITCEAGGIEPWIILTKTDLKPNTQELLTYYRNMGYHILTTSMQQPDSFSVLDQGTCGKTVGLVGASGVGKSTLINYLVGKDLQKTGDINKKFNKGNHTTNYAVLLPRLGGGYWVDTPGVRDLSPVLNDRLDQYYRDFEPYIGQCEFSACLHRYEMQCAVRQAVELGKISEERYQNYCKLLDEETLKTKNSCRYKR